MADEIVLTGADLARCLETGIAKVVRFVSLEVTSNLRAAPQEGGTPIKTGFASASWIPSVGAESDAVAGSPREVDAGASDRGVAEIVSYKLAQGAVFVSNNVPYIAMLNEGHSAQAPAGFVDAAVERAVGAAEQAFQGGL